MLQLQVALLQVATKRTTCEHETHAVSMAQRNYNELNLNPSVHMKHVFNYGLWIKPCKCQGN